MMQIQKNWSVFIICIPSHGTHLSRVEGCRQIHPRHVHCRIASSSGWGGKSDSCDMWRATGAEKVLVISDAGCASCPGVDVRVGILLQSTPKCKLGKQGFKITTTWTMGSNNRLKLNGNKSCCQVQLKWSYGYSAALDNGAVHPCGLVSLLGPKVALQLLPLLCRNHGEGFPQQDMRPCCSKYIKNNNFIKFVSKWIVFFVSDNPARKPK